MTATPTREAPAPNHAAPAPLWLRVAMPSITDLFFVAVFIVMSVGIWASHLLWDTSTGWHIRDGERILRTLSVPRTDPFSYTMAGQPWYAWEWLWDAVNGAVHLKFGLSGVVTLAALLIALTFALLYRTVAARSGNVFVAALLTLLAFSASSIHFLARPHIVSWLLTLVVLRELDALERGARRPLWAIPLIFVLWANLHGGFVIGLVVVGMYCAAAMIEGKSLLARRLAGVLVISAAATVINPYGLKLHLHIISYLASGAQLNHIIEFLSPNFHELQARFFLALIAIAVAGFSAIPRAPWKELLLVVLAVATGLLGARNIPTSSILIVYSTAPLLAGILDSSGFQRLAAVGARLNRVDEQFKGHLLPTLAVISLFALLAGGYALPNARWAPSRVPTKAAAFVVNELGAHEHVFATDFWSGYLIYTFADQGFRVAVDDRSDFYGDKRFGQYRELANAGPDWRRVMDDWQIRYAMVPADSSLRAVLATSPDWNEKYSDKIAAVFVRSASGTAQ